MFGDRVVELKDFGKEFLKMKGDRSVKSSDFWFGRSGGKFLGLFVGGCIELCYVLLWVLI